MLENVCKVKLRLSQINSYRPGDFVGIPDRIHDVLSLSGVTDEIEVGQIPMEQTIYPLLGLQPHRYDDRIRGESLFAGILMDDNSPLICYLEKAEIGHNFYFMEI